MHFCDNVWCLNLYCVCLNYYLLEEIHRGYTLSLPVYYMRYGNIRIEMKMKINIGEKNKTASSIHVIYTFNLYN